jgi:hypothetical protein
MPAKIEITGTAAHLILAGDVPPYHTGKKTVRNHRKVRLRNFVRRKLRICFKSRDSRNIDEIFDSSVTPDAVDPKIGSVIISAAPASGPSFSQEFVFFLESAFLATDKRVTVSANLFTTGVCSFEDISLDHVQDIIIDGS